MAFSMKASGFDQLQQDLKLIPDKILDEGEKIVGKGMRNIQVDARKRVRVEHLAHLPHLPRSFTYDVTRRGYVIRGEAGAELTRLQGGLDIYLELGTATSPPHPHWAPALEAELPNFQRYAEDLLDGLIR